MAFHSIAFRCSTESRTKGPTNNTFTFGFGITIGTETFSSLSFLCSMTFAMLSTRCSEIAGICGVPGSYPFSAIGILACISTSIATILSTLSTAAVPDALSPLAGALNLCSWAPRSYLKETASPCSVGSGTSFSGVSFSTCSTVIASGSSSSPSPSSMASQIPVILER